MRFNDLNLNTTVERAKLLEALKKNREIHKKVYEEAIAGYKDRAVEALRSRVDELLSGKITHLTFNLVKPESHLDDYDTAIKMLEWNTSDKVELAAKEFRQFVMDEWDWAQQFLFTNSAYSATARRMSSERGFGSDG